MRCPSAKCRRWIEEEDARKCPHCGAVVPVGNDSSGWDAVARDAKFDDDLEASIEKEEAEVLGGAFHSAPGSAASGSVGTTELNAGDGGNTEFSFLYDSLVPFCTDCHNCLDIRIVPKVAVNGVCVGIHPSKGVCDECRKNASYDDLGQGSPGQWLVNFDVSGLPPGRVPCTVTLTYCSGGVFREYIGNLNLVVNDRKMAREQAKRNVEVHYDAHVSVAGPISVNCQAGKSSMNIGGLSPEEERKLVDSLNCRDPMDVANELARSGAHKYVGLRLRSRFRLEDERQWQKFDDDEKQCVELRLKNGMRITCFSGTEVRVGHPELTDDGGILRPHAGIMIEPPSVGTDDANGTRQWMPAAPENEKLMPYRRISRHQCEFALGRDDCPRIRDLQSTNGTFFVGKDGSSRLRLGCALKEIKDGELSFGSGTDAFKLDVKSFGDKKSAGGAWSSGAGGAGLCLSRKDGPIHYVLLWNDFDLGLISRAYRNYIVRWDGRLGKFLLEHEGWEEWLLPGRDIKLSWDAPITVLKGWNK